MQTLFHIPYHFHWEPGARFCLVYKKSKHFYIWLSICLFNVSYLTFLTYILALNITSYLDNKSYVSIILHALWIVCVVFQLVNQYPNIFQRHELVYFVNAINGLMKNLETTHFRHTKPFQATDRLRCRQIGILAAYSIYAHLLVLCPIYVIFMDKGVWQLGSQVYRILLSFNPTISIPKSTIVVIGVIVDFWHIAGTSGPMLLNLLINLLFMHLFKSVMHQILTRQKVSRKDWRKRGHELMELKEDLQIYARLRIITTLYNNVFGKGYVSPIKTVMVMCTVMGSVVAVSLHGDEENLLVFLLSLSSGICCGGVLIAFVVFMASIHDYSVKLRDNVRGRTVVLQDKLGKRLVKAFKTEAVKSGIFYAVQKMSCLTLVSFLSNVTGSALISLKF